MTLHPVVRHYWTRQVQFPSWSSDRPFHYPETVASQNVQERATASSTGAEADVPILVIVAVPAPVETDRNPTDFKRMSKQAGEH
jgi:hypothetical protein